MLVAHYHQLPAAWHSVGWVPEMSSGSHFLEGKGSHALETLAIHAQRERSALVANKLTLIRSVKRGSQEGGRTLINISQNANESF